MALQQLQSEGGGVEAADLVGTGDDDRAELDLVAMSCCHHRGVGQAGELVQLRLDVSQHDEAPAHLHLGVETAEDDQGTVFVEASEVPGAVQLPPVTAPRVGGEDVAGQLGVTPVPEEHVGAGDRDLARLPLRDGVALVVEHVELDVGDRVARWRDAVERPIGVDHVEGDDPGLRRAEPVHDEIRAEEVGGQPHHLGVDGFPAEGHHAHGRELEAGHGVDQEPDDRRRHVGHGHTLVDEELGNRGEADTPHIERGELSAVQERQEHGVRRDRQRHREQHRHAVGGSDAQGVGRPTDQVEDHAVRDHRALGTSAGARGERQHQRRGRIRRSRVDGLADEIGEGNGAAAVRPGGDGTGRVGEGDIVQHHRGARLVEHVVDHVRRRGRIEHHHDVAGGDHREDGHDERPVVLREHGHRRGGVAVDRTAQRPAATSDLVDQLRVGPRARRRAQGDGVGMVGGDIEEPFEHGALDRARRERDEVGGRLG